MNVFNEQQNEEGKVIIHPAAKEILTLSEACDFAGISKSQMYKLTSTNRIPFYRPMGKLIYFKREELLDWLLSNKVEMIQNMGRVCHG